MTPAPRTTTWVDFVLPVSADMMDAEIGDQGGVV